MRHIAIVGSGPAGYYTAEACVRMWGKDVRIDMIDRMPVPFGLLRSGVAPDHQAIKRVARDFEQVAMTDQVRFVGHVTVGQDIDVAEIMELYDAVVIATGAPQDRPLGIPGDDLPGVIGSAAFFGWYNGHPEQAGLNPPLSGAAVLIGNGNVASDVARVLAKTPAELAGSDMAAHAREALGRERPPHIVIAGRRGPHQMTMTARELGEIADLQGAVAHVDRADLPPVSADGALTAGPRKAMNMLRAMAALPRGEAPVEIDFRFFSRPVAIEGGDRVERVLFERTKVDADGQAVGMGEIHAEPASLVISCIGYRTPPIAGVPYDAGLGRFASQDGRMGDGLYCVGWARRGPTGTIGANRPDGYRIAELIGQDAPGGSGKEGRAGLDRLLGARGVDLVTFRDWQNIDRLEREHARAGAPREKIVAVEEMMAAAHMVG